MRSVAQNTHLVSLQSKKGDKYSGSVVKTKNIFLQKDSHITSSEKEHRHEETCKEIYIDCFSYVRTFNHHFLWYGK